MAQLIFQHCLETDVFTKLGHVKETINMYVRSTVRMRMDSSPISTKYRSRKTRVLSHGLQRTNCDDIQPLARSANKKNQKEQSTQQPRAATMYTCRSVVAHNLGNPIATNVPLQSRRRGLRREHITKKCASDVAEVALRCL